MARQEGVRHRAWMLVLLPEASVVGELLSDHRVHVYVLRDMIVVFSGILEGASAVGRDPNGRMGLLIGFGGGQGLVELPVLALVGDRVLRPRLDNELQRFRAHLMALIEGQIP